MLLFRFAVTLRPLFDAGLSNTCCHVSLHICLLQSACTTTFDISNQCCLLMSSRLTSASLSTLPTSCGLLAPLDTSLASTCLTPSRSKPLSSCLDSTLRTLPISSGLLQGMHPSTLNKQELPQSLTFMRHEDAVPTLCWMHKIVLECYVCSARYTF